MVLVWYLLAYSSPSSNCATRLCRRTCSTRVCRADLLVGKLNKDISYALRRGTIAQVTSALNVAQRAVEDELVLNEAGWGR